MYIFAGKLSVFLLNIKYYFDAFLKKRNILKLESVLKTFFQIMKINKMNIKHKKEYEYKKPQKR